MSHGAPLQNPKGYRSVDDSDSDTEPDQTSRKTPRSQGDPNTSTSGRVAPGITPQTEDPTVSLRELQGRERELSKRTAIIESLLVNLTATLNQRAPPPSTSNPGSQFPGHIPSFSANAPPEQPMHRPGLLPPLPPLSISASSNALSDSAVREALELVPKFDGHNMPVLQFARSCKRAKELLPFANEPHIVRLLRNKLTGHAYLAVEDKMHDTIDQFIDCLKRAFGPARNPNYYRGQLSVNYMKENEHIFDYIGRVKDLRCAIIEADQTLYGRALSNIELTYIDTFTLDSFYDGLPPDLRTELRNEGYQNLDDAYDKAVSATKRLERDRARRPNARGRHPASPAPVVSPSFNNTSGNPPPSVTILKRASAPPFRSSVAQPATTSPSLFPTKICNYCKKMGHLISECRKRQYNNSNSNTRQGNLSLASDSGETRGQSTARTTLPLSENLQPSIYSNLQPGTSRQ